MSAGGVGDRARQTPGGQWGPDRTKKGSERRGWRIWPYREERREAGATVGGGGGGGGGGLRRSAAEAAELASVMRSLEAEIDLPAPPRDDPDLGFLFAASDDELGLPPPRSPPPPPPPLDGGDSATEGGGGGFGEIWGFEEETYLAPAPAPEKVVGGGEGFEGFGGGDDDDDEEMVVGLFEWSDVMMSCGPSDLADVSWRSESLPAV
ncbi:homeobox protein Hox-D11-like [Ananas comosus]|uniref:Homeobox protein Hox-D11-like n=1 Tax=Ananas comosus TaxID=4615 RepID=A0A6P5F710_ANACO|nr:homeobox protein Hox-D11-like [Ananas comosus]